MPRLPSTLQDRVASVALRWTRRSMLAEIGRGGSPFLTRIERAFRGALRGAGTEAERAWIERIEERRRRLSQSAERVEVVDHGAGNPGSRRTRDAARRGVRTTLSLAQVATTAIPALRGRILFRLARELRPASCLELGTGAGIGAAYLAAALRLDGSGRLLSVEGAPEIARIGRETLAGLELGNVEVVEGPFHETLEAALERARPIDFCFNDGHHDGEAVLEYFAAILPHLADESVLVLDDIGWSSGMAAAWREIRRDPRVVAAPDLAGLGIAVVSRFDPASGMRNLERGSPDSAGG